MESILKAILDDDRRRVRTLLKGDPQLATCLVETPRLYTSKIFHWIYVGDTALHLAASGCRVEIVQLLLAAGADPNARMNHRESRPLHYAADGQFANPHWDPKQQVETILCLIKSGADIDAPDKNGATPLHRAVRTRCAAAVKCLFDQGSDPMLKNKPGSTPFHLAVQNTGRGGSGTATAKAAQREIILEFLARGLKPTIKDSRGKSVFSSARSSWIRDLLSEDGGDPE
jgi:hypothetical protein